MARNILRETKWLIAEEAKNGVKISTKDPKARPRSRTVSMATWEQMNALGDDSFEQTAVWDLGIGVFVK
jgi:hypothetical protein